MGPEGTVPLANPQTQQTQQQTAAQGIDILNQLISQRNSLNEGISKLSKAATIPVAGASAGTSPALAISPVRQFQPAPLIEKETTGARSTRDKGIANAIIGAANVVGQYEEKHDQEQQRVLAVDIERLFQAQDGIREAQQTLQVDPNNADAQSTIKKNSGIIDAMLSDPSRRKKIAKALDISFTDPSKNDAMEHGALKQASESYTQQLNKAVPQQMQPNIVAQQKLALMTAQQQAIDKMIGQITPTLVREQGAAQRAEIADQTKRDIAEANINSRQNVAQLQAATRYKSAIDSASIHANATLKATAMRNAQSAANTQANINARIQLLQNKQTDPVYQLKGTIANMQEMTRFTTGLNNQNKTLVAQKQQIAVMLANGQIDKKTATTQQAGIDELIKANNETINEYKKLHDQSAAYIENLTKGLQSGDNTRNNSKSESGQPTVGAAEDTEDTDLDPDDY